MKSLLAVVLAAILLSGCGHSGGGSGAVTPAGINAGIAAECRLLQKAFDSSGKIETTIVSGCPGHENAPSSASKIIEATRLTRALSAPTPAHVKAAGETAIRIFRRMISRGTPVNIATKLSGSEEFKATVAAQQ